MGPFATYFPKMAHQNSQISSIFYVLANNLISLRFLAEILSKWPIILGSRVNPAGDDGRVGHLSTFPASPDYRFL